MNKIINSPIISLKAHNIILLQRKLHTVEGRPFNSISYRKEGVVNFYVKGKKITSQPGSVLFMPNEQAYETEIMEDTHFLTIHFQTLGKITPVVPFIMEHASSQLQNLFELVLNHYSATSTSFFKCYSYFYNLLAEIEKYVQKKYTVSSNPTVSKAKSEIERNFSDNNFNIDSLVSCLDISASHLRNEFRKKYSATPIEYLKHVRLQNAITLLASGYYSIQEIAEKSGYSSTSYFIQSFQRATGYSPTKYKEKFLSK